jgi:hypothetical protein
MPASVANRRKHTRVPMRLQTRVHGLDPDGKPWEESTNTHDVSAGGVALQLTHRVVKGQVIRVSLDLPVQLRYFDEGQPVYRVYALVRNVIARDGCSWVRVKFLGKKPPKDYEENPGCRYLLPTDPPPERQERRHARRLSVFVTFELKRPTVAQSEKTVAENLSRHGARVMTALPVEKGEVIEIVELGGSFKTRAEVRNLFQGADNITRLNLLFLDGEVPPHLLPAD